jgi:16S rRNA (uracil1498-N3)-methyltransferase
MRHFQLPLSVGEGSRCTIGGDDFHYLAHVRRVVAGDEIPVIDRSGTAYLAVVDEIKRDGIRLFIARARDSLATSGVPTITLYQALPKGRKLEEIVRAAVQAGVSRIVPVRTRRTVANPGDRFVARRDRLNRIAREATQQSGAVAATVDQLIELEEVRPEPDATSLLLHVEPLERQSIHGYLSENPRRVELLVGPEGGLADDEISRLIELGFRPVNFGPLVLRTEVAGLYAVAAIRTILLERDQWQLTTNPTS